MKELAKETNMIAPPLSRRQARFYRKPLSRMVPVFPETGILQASLKAGRERIGELTEAPAWDDLSDE